MEPRFWGRALWTVIFILLRRFEEHGSLERCKRELYVVCSTLPCVACRRHALAAISGNNVMSSEDPNFVLFFFVSLFNNLAFDDKFKIDVSKVRPLRYSMPS
ncbi:putative IMV redox protein [Equine parapoxvirus]|nr:putative IMV redox protein [Equine parapoxvirus]WOC29296.1 putative IMV redox protein [Equine parapoxvirus]WOC29304.1 putative IMV redox protein [Equine parapoxvirus]WOC29312.1 putative IMV redox protein [Equine parapoxvirus]